eukprot:scaffold1722_cov380-Prasinococcus_capsulatus_cf.AAC.2
MDTADTAEVSSNQLDQQRVFFLQEAAMMVPSKCYRSCFKSCDETNCIEVRGCVGCAPEVPPHIEVPVLVTRLGMCAGIPWLLLCRKGEPKHGRSTRGQERRTK